MLTRRRNKRLIAALTRQRDELLARQRPVLLPRAADEPAPAAYRPGRVPVPVTDDVEQYLVSLRAACDSNLIPRELDHARQDRHRHDDYPERVRREDGTDLFDETELFEWYASRPHLRSDGRRPAARPRHWPQADEAMQRSPQVIAFQRQILALMEPDRADEARQRMPWL